MGVTISARRQVFHPELGYGSGLRAKIGNIDDDELLRHFRVEQCKNKVRASKACIDYCYIVGKLEHLHLLDYCRAKTVIGKQGVSTPCYHDL